MDKSPAKSPTHVARGRLGGLRRVGAEPERINEAITEVRTTAAEEYIRRLVATAPPLTAEQRDRIASLLRPSSGEGAAA